MLEINASDAIHYIVSPASLQAWFSAFVDLTPGGRIIYNDEKAPIDDEKLLEQLNASGPPDRNTVVFCSSHQSLAHDCELAERLHAQGYKVTGINRAAVLYGENKHRVKELLNILDIATPAWVPLDSGDTVEMIRSRLNKTAYIFKECSSTSGEGNCYCDSAPIAITNRYYAEVFEEGDEYSVVALSSAGNIVTFPPVWKGTTRRDLLPPDKRLRVCPYPHPVPSLEKQMHMIAEKLTLASGISGLLEVEYIVTPDQRLLVIEINPRLAGTVLMSAMATETRIFNLLGHGIQGHKYTQRPATCFTIEMPWQGQEPQDSPQGAYFTSRMTVSGSTFQHILVKIQAVIKLGVVPDVQALDMFTTQVMRL